MYDWTFFSWIEENFFEKMTEMTTANYHSAIDTFYNMPSLAGTILLDASTKDSLKSQIAFQLIGFIIFLGTGSIWLSIVGIWEIVFSLPVGEFVFLS